MAGLEIFYDVVDGPCAQAASRVAGDVGREPALQRIASQTLAGLIAAEKVFRRMTHAAMPWTLGEVGAAIPFGALPGDRLKWPRLEIQCVPHRHGCADVERKRQLVRVDRVVYRTDRIEIGADG